MKKILSLILALSMLLTMGFAAMADGEKHVTISIINTQEDDHPKNLTDDLSPELQKWYDKVQHLVPGLIIDLDMWYFEDTAAQLPLLLAAGDVPDIFISDKTDFMQYMDLGFFIEDLTPYVNEYCQNAVENIEEVSWNICTVDGKIRAIPCENFYYKFPTIMRADWLEKLGYEFDEEGFTTFTLSELSEILKKFTTMDPDGNGVDDTYGLGTRYNGGDWTQTFMPIFGAFGGQPHQNYIKDDVCTPYDVSDDFRDAMVYLADLYAVGAIDKECFILNYDQARLNAANGKGGVYSGWWNVTNNIIDAGLIDNNPEARLCYIMVTSDDGLTTGVKNNGIVWKTAMISNECESPEAAVALINYMHTYEGNSTGNMTILDEEGHFTYDDSGIKTKEHRLYETANWSIYENDEARYAAGFRKSPLSNLFNNMKIRQIGAKASLYAQTVEDQSNYSYRTKVCANGEYLEANIDNNPTYLDCFYGYVATPEYLEYYAALETYMKEWVVNFVTGVKPVDDASWAEYCNGYVAKGGQKVLDSMLKQYNEMNATAVTAFQIAK